MNVLNIKSVETSVKDETESTGVLIFKDIEVAKSVHKSLGRYLLVNDESKRLCVISTYGGV